MRALREGLQVAGNDKETVNEMAPDAALTPAQRLRVYAAAGNDQVTITIDTSLLKAAARGLEQEDRLVRAVGVVMDMESSEAARRHHSLAHEETLQRVFFLEWLCVTCALLATLSFGMSL